MDEDNTVTVTIRLRQGTLRRLDEKARAEHRSRNRQVLRFIERGLGEISATEDRRGE